MRRLRKLIIIGAATVALGAGGATLAVTASAGGSADGTAVTSTITLTGGDYPFTFAPPPGNAAPQLTPQEAAARYAEVLTGKSGFQIPDDVTVQLGLYTQPVGDASVCEEQGENCSGYTITGGVAYKELNQLVYGYSAWRCPDQTGQDPRLCTQWLFLDANTGAWVGEVGPVGSTTGAGSADSSPAKTSPQG